MKTLVCTLPLLFLFSSTLLATDHKSHAHVDYMHLFNELQNESVFLTRPIYSENTNNKMRNIIAAQGVAYEKRIEASQAICPELNKLVYTTLERILTASQLRPAVEFPRKTG